MNPKAVDIHTHIHFEAYKNDMAEVIENARSRGVSMITVGTQKDTSLNGVMVAESYSAGVYATVGLHPIHAGGSTYHDKKELSNESYKKKDGIDWDYDFYKKLAQSKKVVAIGECGLDFYRCSDDSKVKQKKIFIEQIHLANELDKPLMLHVRGERGDDTPYKYALDIIKSEAKVLGNFHFFAGSLQVAKKIWEIGFSTSFTGVITFTRDYDEVIKAAPNDLIMTETDAPYVAPVPFRGKRNEPMYVLEIVKRISEIRNEESSIKLYNNAERIFHLD